MIHVSRFSALVDVNEPLPERRMRETNSTCKDLARHVASLVEDGATLQAGIGAIPDAVMAELGHLKHLGLHTEMWSDGALALIKKGVIDNSRKK
jgi:acetyl-CoA hydrolase